MIYLSYNGYFIVILGLSPSLISAPYIWPLADICWRRLALHPMPKLSITRFSHNHQLSSTAHYFCIIIIFEFIIFDKLIGKMIGIRSSPWETPGALSSLAVFSSSRPLGGGGEGPCRAHDMTWTLPVFTLH